MTGEGVVTGVSADMHLQVFVLGSLQVRCAGRVVELGPTRRRAALAALVIDANRTVTQDALVDRIWDGAPPDSASTSVHAYVSRLRSAIRAASGTGDEQPIVTGNGGYRLVLPDGALDADRFADALARARQAWGGEDAATTARSAREALKLWRADTAYADLPIPFALREAERLAAVRLAAQVLAVDADLALGRHTELVDEVRALVHANPFAEHLHAVLMTALYRSGHQADALSQFTAVRKLLGAELGISPGPELMGLHAAILRGDAALAAAARPAMPASPPIATLTPTTVEAPPASPMIGREGEAARIRSEVAGAWTVAARTVVVVGEAGIGKTRLLEQAVADVTEDDVLVAWGRCWQYDGAPRMWPWIQVLRSLADRVGPAEVASAARGVEDVLLSILPGLSSDAGTVVPVEDIDASELRLFDAVTRMLGRLARDRRLLILLEDMHWADASSRRMIEYGRDNLTAAGVAFVVSVRWPSDEATAATNALLAQLTRSARSTRVDLNGFGPADVREFVASRTGGQIDDPTTTALLERTDGNPFFLGEIVRLIVTDTVADGETGAAPGPSVTEEVPDTVRAVVLARLERLFPGQRAVLDAAAVVGRTFDLALLVVASDLEEDDVDEAIDAATATGIVASEPGWPGQHRFAHALVQQTLLEAIGPSRRRRLHRRVAEELQRRAGSRALDPAGIVHHLIAAGTEETLRAALELCVASAAGSRRRGDIASAEAILLRALDATARMRGPEAAQGELAARLQLLSLYTLISPSAPDAQRQRERVVGLAREIGDAEQLLLALQGVLSDAAIRGDLDVMQAVADELAAAGDERNDDVLRAAAPLAAAHARFHRGRRPHETVALADEAVRRFEDPALKIPFGAFPLEPARAARTWRAFTLAVAGDHEACDAQLDELAPLLRPPYPDTHTVLYVNVMLGLLEAARDDPDAAAERVAAARAEQARVGLIGDGLPYLDAVAAWSRERSEPGSGLSTLRSVLNATATRPTMSQRPFLFGLLADVLMRSGEVVEAGTIARRALAEAASIDEHWSDAILLRIVAATDEDVPAQAVGGFELADAPGAAEPDGSVRAK